MLYIANISKDMKLILNDSANLASWSAPWSPDGKAPPSLQMVGCARGGGERLPPGVAATARCCGLALSHSQTSQTYPFPCASTQWAGAVFPLPCLQVRFQLAKGKHKELHAEVLKLQEQMP